MAAPSDPFNHDIWVLILAHVPIAQRHRSCALVSTKLHAAVVAATDRLRVALRDTRKHKRQRNQERVQSLIAYLQHYGTQRLTRLLFDMHLPCPCTLRVGLAAKLQFLQISGALRKGLPVLQLVGGSTGEGVLDVCSRLTCLSLHDCGIHGVSPAAFANFTALVDLRLASVWFNDVLASFPGTVLPSLPHLTFLHLSGVDVEDVHHVSALSKLRVSISGTCLHARNPLAHRPHCLHPLHPTFLHFQHPCIPASLQELMLVKSISIAPAVLSGVLSLTQLVLDDMAVPGDGSVLLSAVGRLQNLVVLDLQYLRDVVWPPASAEYAALTASPKLKQLTVVRTGLPSGAWVDVFAPERTLGLKLVVVDERSLLALEAVSHLVQCCPLVENLSLCLCAHALVALSPLTGLKRLTLIITSGAEDVAASMHSITTLTNLRSLIMYTTAADTGNLLRSTCLLPLTALRRLSHFKVMTVPHFDCCCTLTNKAGQPVWQQLETWCLEEQVQQLSIG